MRLKEIIVGAAVAGAGHAPRTTGRVWDAGSQHWGVWMNAVFIPTF
jgi:hypothetical protein